MTCRGRSRNRGAVPASGGRALRGRILDSVIKGRSVIGVAQAIEPQRHLPRTCRMATHRHTVARAHIPRWPLAHEARQEPAFIIDLFWCHVRNRSGPQQYHCAHHYPLPLSRTRTVHLYAQYCLQRERQAAGRVTPCARSTAVRQESASSCRYECSPSPASCASA